ncbi:hypothetical protein ACIBTV_27310 [Micromonospora sp. NPDC049366]|uniref:hypothetical protein n=1 Tax=Micromonospora sp. NPDC049366 TaxID=3364271 RepID=UPI0037A95D7B
MIVLRRYREYRRRGRILAERGRAYGAGRPRDWLWWALIDELQSARYGIRNAFDMYVPLPAAWDIALSWWDRRRLIECHPGFADDSIEVPGWCPLCSARWHAGRPIRHRPCARALERFVELRFQDRTARRG